MNLFCYIGFIFTRRFIFISHRFILLLPLYFVVAALDSFSLLYFVVAALDFFLLPLNFIVAALSFCLLFIIFSPL